MPKGNSDGHLQDQMPWMGSWAMCWKHAADAPVDDGEHAGKAPLSGSNTSP